MNLRKEYLAMNITIDREKFKEMLKQFKGDVGYQAELVKVLFSQLPDSYVNELVNTLYFERVYEGTYYLIQHHLYPQDRKLVKTFDECFDYLSSICFETITPIKLRRAISNKSMLCGYYITRYRNHTEVRGDS